MYYLIFKKYTKLIEEINFYLIKTNWNILHNPNYLTSKSPRSYLKNNRSVFLWNEDYLPGYQHLRSSYAYLLKSKLADSLYTEYFYYFTGVFNFGSWRSIKHCKPSFSTTMQFIVDSTPAYLTMEFLFKSKKARSIFRYRKWKNVVYRKNIWKSNKLTDLKTASLVKKGLHHSRHRLSIKKHNNFRFAKFNVKVSSYSQTPKFFLNPRRSKLFTNKIILDFKLKTSRFLKNNLNRTIIKYNLKRIFKPSSFFKLRALSRFINAKLTNTHQRPGYDFKRNVLIKKAKRFSSLRAMRRITMFWVSKLNQKKLNPVRRDFKILDRKFIKNQRRITLLTFKYYNFKVLEIINKLEFNVIRVLLRTGFFFYKPTVILIIQKGFLFINNFKITSLNAFLGKGDLIQLTSQLKLILFLKWNILTNRANIRRFFIYLGKWRRRGFRPFPKRSSYRIPNWIRTRLLFKETVPSFMEVDLTTSSVIILFDWTYDLFNYHFMSINQDSPATVRPLNWKSIT
jgi:hypothetical protein